MLNSFIHYAKLAGNQISVLRHEDLLKTNLHATYSFIYLPSFAIHQSMHINKEGLKSAIIEANYGIAETGSLVVNLTTYELRAASCLAERLDAIIFKSKIVNKLEDISDFLKKETSSNAYISFITGPSRTADIERTLTIGVHGPSEMNIFIIEDK